MYIVNKRGPRIAPWGTPQKRGTLEQAASPGLAEKDLGDEPIPWRITDANRVFQMAGSEAELRSRRIKMDYRPVSAVSSKSLVTHQSSPSVL